MSEFEYTTEPTYRVDIFIAGPIPRIEMGCQRFCERGLCVHVQPAEYIYTYGRESGAKIGLINYPRFPTSPGEIRGVAFELAEYLLRSLSQRSCCIVTPEDTTWIHRGVDPNPPPGE